MKESIVSLVSPLQVSRANENPHSEVKVNDYKVETFLNKGGLSPPLAHPPPPPPPQKASLGFFQLCDIQNLAKFSENLAKVVEFALGKVKK
jgi:hypothetical protein